MNTQLKRGKIQFSNPEERERERERESNDKRRKNGYQVAQRCHPPFFSNCPGTTNKRRAFLFDTF